MDLHQAYERILGFLSQQNCQTGKTSAEAIFTFGHVDPRLAKHVAKLRQEGAAERIILTGKGSHDRLPAGFSSEAEYYASLICQELKLPDLSAANIIVEKESSNSLNNVLYGMRAYCQKHHLPRTLIICSLPPLLIRSRATFQKQYPQISIFASTFMPEPDEYFNQKWLKRLLGEFERLEDYSLLGHTAEVAVPYKVAKAVKALKSYL